MLNRLMVGVALAGALVWSVADAQTPASTIRLTQAVIADGQPLAAGAYRVRLTNDEPKTAIGQSPGGERWIEFLRNGAVVGREVATVIPADEIREAAKGPPPKAEGARVDTLKGGEYVRVWINRGGLNYFINMPLAR